MKKIIAFIFKFFTVTLVISLSVICFYGNKHLQENLQLSTSMNKLILQLERKIMENFVLLNTVKDRVISNPELNTVEFNRIASCLFNKASSLKSIALAPVFQFTHVYPLEDNQSIIGVKLENIPEQWLQVLQAKYENLMLLSGPLPLIQGGEGLLARVPVYLNDDEGHFWGIVSAVLDLSKFKEMFVEFSQTNNVKIRVFNREHEIFSNAGTEDHHVFYSVKYDYEFPGSIWGVELLSLNQLVYQSEIIVIIFIYAALIFGTLFLGRKKADT